jgi:hypothetical protein
MTPAQFLTLIAFVAAAIVVFCVITGARRR